MKKNSLVIGIIVVICLSLTVFTAYQNKLKDKVLKEMQQQVGSVTFGNEFFSTTTDPTYHTFDTQWVLKRGAGALGSVVIMKAGTCFDIWDATTTDIVSGNSARVATTSLRLLASFGSDATVGTYVYDSVAYTGILISTKKGSNMATTTITYR